MREPCAAHPVAKSEPGVRGDAESVGSLFGGEIAAFPEGTVGSFSDGGLHFVGRGRLGDSTT
ncbi:MAG: hypothetical protein ACSHYB_05155 [Roseibacillus sp.]